MAKTIANSGYSVFYNGQLLPTARVTEVDQSLGGRQEDYAKLEIPFIDERAKDELNRLIVTGGDSGSYFKSTNDVYLINGCAPARISIVIDGGEVIHLGVITEMDYSDSDVGEVINVVSRADNAMFGDPISGMPVHSGKHDAATLSRDFQVGRKLIFNPFMDGKQYPNCWNANTATQPLFEKIAFMDIESIPHKYINDPLDVADKVPNVQFWTIQLAVWYLCHHLNPNEQFFVNPTFQEVEAAIPGDDQLADILAGKAPSYMLLGFEIPLNSTLPEALDLILRPFGAYWYLQTIPGNVSKRKIAFGERHIAENQRQRILYKPDTLNPGVPICEDYQLHIDRSGRFASDVIVIGGPVTFEITMELMAGWAPAKDNTALHELSMEKLSKSSDKADIRRRWVANETGEYNDWLVAGTPGRSTAYMGPRVDLLAGIKSALQAADTLGDLEAPELPKQYARRFKAGKCLTLDATGESIGTGHGQVLLEVKREGGQWVDLTQHDGNSGWQLLENEIGIYFTGTLPPSTITPGQYQMRMTFSVTLPTAIRGVAEFENVTREKFLGYRRPHVSHEPTRFNFRYRDTPSKFHGATPATTYDKVDDRKRIVEYAKQLHKAWSTATCEGSASIQGLTTLYRLGDQIVGVQEDNINFDVASGLDARHPSVTGIRHLPQESKTIIRFGLFGREDFI